MGHWRGDVTRVCMFSRLVRPGMGDLVQRNIFLKLLRDAFPHATVCWIVSECVTRVAYQDEMVRRHSYADEIIVCPDADADTGIRDGDARWQRFLGELTGRRFQVCVVDPSSVGMGVREGSEAGIAVRAAIPLGVSDDDLITHPMRLPRPLLAGSDLYDFATSLARALEITPIPRPGDVVARLPLRPEPLPPWAARPPLVGLHPGGAKGWNRRWPLASYAELAMRIVDATDATLLILGSLDEIDETRLLRGEILRRWPQAAVHVSLGEPLNRVVNLIEKMDLLVGNDSGPAHLAAAVATPTVVVYGPTGTEAMWARVYPHHLGVNKNYPCQKLRHDPAGAVGQCEHACPCYYVAPEGPYPKCLTDITVEQMWQAVHTQLTRLR